MNEEQFLELISKTKQAVEHLSIFESVCICGSSKFSDLIAVAKWELEKRGIMATGLHFLPEWYWKGAKLKESHHAAEQEGVAQILDELHLKKIDKYEAVLVVNFNGYIGDRTKIEIEYAKQHGKPIVYWES